LGSWVAACERLLWLKCGTLGGSGISTFILLFRWDTFGCTFGIPIFGIFFAPVDGGLGSVKAPMRSPLIGASWGAGSFVPLGNQIGIIITMGTYSESFLFPSPSTPLDWTVVVGGDVSVVFLGCDWLRA